MSDLRKAAAQALEALELSRVFVTSREKTKHPEGTEWYDERIDALRAALAQPEQTRSQQMRDAGYTRRPRQLPREDEPVQVPVAWLRQRDNVLALNDGGLFGSDWTPLYTVPLQRKPLTEEDIFRVAYAEFPYWSQDIQSAFVTQFARAIEAAHGIGGEHE